MVKMASKKNLLSFFVIKVIMQPHPPLVQRYQACPVVMIYSNNCLGQITATYIFGDMVCVQCPLSLGNVSAIAREWSGNGDGVIMSPLKWLERTYLKLSVSVQKSWFQAQLTRVRRWFVFLLRKLKIKLLKHFRDQTLTRLRKYSERYRAHFNSQRKHGSLLCPW